MPRVKTRYYPDYGPLLPFAGPDWVFRRAECLIHAGRNASQKRDGPDIIRVMKYLRARDRNFLGRWSRHKLDDPEIYAAFETHRKSHLYILELQCRVLAGEANGRIAIEMGITRPTLRTYLKTFFDVRERLDQRGYILHRVIGAVADRPLTAFQLALRSAYHHGSAAIPAWIDWLRNPEAPNDLTTIEGRRREAIEIQLAAEQVESIPRGGIRMAKWRAFYAENEPKMFRIRSPREVIAENIAETIRKLSFDGPEGDKKQVAKSESCKTESTGEDVNGKSSDLGAKVARMELNPPKSNLLPIGAMSVTSAIGDFP